MTRDDWDMTGMTRIEWHVWVPGKTGMSQSGMTGITRDD